MNPYKSIVKAPYKRVFEAEQSSKLNPKLVQQALIKAQKEHNDWMEDMIKTMNPKKLSQSDMETLNDFMSS